MMIDERRVAYVWAILDIAFSLLPEKFDSALARILLIAIGLQESRLTYRRQLVGPARGLWQFEIMGAATGVLRHPASRDLMAATMATLAYPTPDPQQLHAALENNDVLAAVAARLLLWTHPFPLPTEALGAWQYYVDTWRPGKPHPETWLDCYAEAQSIVAANSIPTITALHQQ